MIELPTASLGTKNRLSQLDEESSSVRGGRNGDFHDKVEAIFIASEPNTVRELLNVRCGLDIAMSRVNHPRAVSWRGDSWAHATEAAHPLTPAVESAPILKTDHEVRAYSTVRADTNRARG